MLDFNSYGLDTEWTEFYTGNNNGSYDYIIQLSFQSIQISPEQEKVEVFNFEKNIIDGKTELKKNGQIVKDNEGLDCEFIGPRKKSVVYVGDGDVKANIYVRGLIKKNELVVLFSDAYDKLTIDPEMTQQKKTVIRGELAVDLKEALEEIPELFEEGI